MKKLPFLSPFNFLKLIPIIFMPIVLLACGGSGEQQVRQWMEQTKLETRPFITPLKEPKDFIPFTYGKKKELDPFNSGKLQAALAKMNPGSANGIKPDLERRREVLELFPLDELKMVGTLTKGTTRYALLEVNSKGVYQVRAGNYVGQNFGLVTKVGDDLVEIKEIYLDSNGDWAERAQKLELQETKK